MRAQSGQPHHALMLGALVMWTSDDPDTKLYPQYSGRSMYGNTCIGVVVQDEMQVRAMISEVIINQINELHGGDGPNENYESQQMALEEMINGLLQYRTDSMGKSLIVYWPDLVVAVDDESEEEDEI